MRLGYELSQSPSSVGSGTTSVTVTLKVYFESKASVVDSSNSFTITGNFSESGSENINHGSGGGVTLLQTETRVVTTSYTSTTTSSFTATISGINAISGSASVSGSIVTGKRPISAPAAPTGIAVSRSSDTSHTITWTRTNPTSASNPYENMEVQRWSSTTGIYSTIATLGSVSSYTNTSTSTNNQYRWRVRAKNSAGASAWIYSGFWSTTPAAPDAPVAKKISNDIQLNWTNRNQVNSGGVEVWHAANGVWDVSVLSATSSNPSISTWTHVAPNPAQTHQYKLKAYAGSTDDAPTTFSGFSGASNVIQLLTNPAAPNNLSPTSGVKDAATTAIVLSWNHNEVDGTAQTKYDIQYRMNGGSWTTVSATTSVQSRTFAAGSLTNGGTFEWQVRTYGAYAVAPAYSPWSAIATITLSAAPNAGVLYPDSAVAVATSRITASWTYSDPEATAQAGYRVKLYSAGGAKVLEDKSGSGAVTSLALTTVLKNSTSYRLGVSVQDGSGLWSSETFEDFNVVYALPPVPIVTLLFDEDDASVQVSIQNPVNVGDAAVTSYNEVWRSVDWINYDLLATNVPVNSTITDYIPDLGTENVYKVIAVTSIGATAESDPLVFDVPDTGGWFWFNGGPAFSDVIKVRYSPARSQSFSRSKTLNNYAGRQFPVETAGEQRSREFDLSVVVFGEDDATLEDLERIADLTAPICVRTPTGDRKYVSIASVGASSSGPYESATVKMTQISPPLTPTMEFDPVVYRTNLATNPSFEVDTTSWSTSGLGTGGSAAVSSDWFMSGTQSLKVINNSVGDSGDTRVGGSGVMPFGVVPGRTYTVSGFTYLPAAYVNSVGTRQRRIIVFTQVGAAAFVADYGPQCPNTPGVHRVSHTFTIPANVTGVIIALGSGSSPSDAGIVTYWDSIIVEETNTLKEYFDGDTWEGDTILDASWTGTPNASTSVLTRGGQ